MKPGGERPTMRDDSFLLSHTQLSACLGLVSESVQEGFQHGIQCRVQNVHLMGEQAFQLGQGLLPVSQGLEASRIPLDERKEELKRVRRNLIRVKQRR